MSATRTHLLVLLLAIASRVAPAEEARATGASDALGAGARETEATSGSSCATPIAPWVEEGVAADEARERADWLSGFAATGDEAAGFEWRLQAVRVEDGVFDLHFDSPRPSGVAENDQVPCRFYRARGATAESPAPGALVLHHLGGDFGVERALAAYLARSGVHALEIEFPYYGDRKPPDRDPRKEILMRDVALWIEPMRQVVADIRRALDWLEARADVDRARTGVVGVSLGGIIGALVAGVDPRLERNVLLIAGGELADVVLAPSRETQEIRATLVERGIEREALRERLRPIEPLVAASRIDPDGLLLVCAEKDQVVPRSSTDALIAATGATNIVWYPADHYTIAVYLGDILPRVRDHFLPATPAVAPDEPPPEQPPGEPEDDDEYF